jgi:dihydroxyacid dehydratase/phosphogluconate dehydratase
LALTFAAEGELMVATQWLDQAAKRCVREIDPYVGLQVEILASKAEISQRLGQEEVASSLSREWIALAARAHMDAHVARAAAFLAGRRSS